MYVMCIRIHIYIYTYTSRALTAAPLRGEADRPRGALPKTAEDCVDREFTKGGFSKRGFSNLCVENKPNC